MWIYSQVPKLLERGGWPLVLRSLDSWATAIFSPKVGHLGCDGGLVPLNIQCLGYVSLFYYPFSLFWSCSC